MKSEMRTDLLLAKKVKSDHPEIVAQYEERIKQLPIIFEFYSDLSAYRDAFCEFAQIEPASIIGTGHPIEFNECKKKFIGAMIRTYHPDMITGHDEKIKDRLCKEIGNVLKCKREQVSLYASQAITMLNPDKTLGMYVAFRKEVQDIVDYLSERFGEPPVEDVETKLFG